MPTRTEPPPLADRETGGGGRTFCPRAGTEQGVEEQWSVERRPPVRTVATRQLLTNKLAFLECSSSFESWTVELLNRRRHS